MFVKRNPRASSALHEDQLTDGTEINLRTGTTPRRIKTEHHIRSAGRNKNLRGALFFLYLPILSNSSARSGHDGDDDERLEIMVRLFLRHAESLPPNFLDSFRNWNWGELLARIFAPRVRLRDTVQL